MRTVEEIKSKIKSEQGKLLSFHPEVLTYFLKFEDAKEFLKEDVKEEKWNTKSYLALTKENIIKSMGDYMGFAWEKCQDHRGLSASCSIDKMQAHLWLLEDQELLDFTEDNYAPYGAPILHEISKKYSFDIPEGEDIERMIKGVRKNEVRKLSENKKLKKETKKDESYKRNAHQSNEGSG